MQHPAYIVCQGRTKAERVKTLGESVAKEHEAVESAGHAKAGRMLTIPREDFFRMLRMFGVKLNSKDDAVAFSKGNHETV